MRFAVPMCAAGLMHAALIAAVPGMPERDERGAPTPIAALVTDATRSPTRPSISSVSSDLPAPPAPTSPARPRRHDTRRAPAARESRGRSAAPLVDAAPAASPAAVAPAPADRAHEPDSALANTVPPTNATPAASAMGARNHALSGTGSGDAPGSGGRTGASGPGTTAPGEHAAGASADLRHLIVDRIRAHRQYPPLARRRGIEGTVGLRIAIRGDGSVDVRVVRSADPSLDEAARQAVLAAAPLPSVAGPLDLDLAFRLHDD